MGKMRKHETMIHAFVLEICIDFKSEIIHVNLLSIQTTYVSFNFQ